MCQVLSQLAQIYSFRNWKGKEGLCTNIKYIISMRCLGWERLGETVQAKLIKIIYYIYPISKLFIKCLPREVFCGCSTVVLPEYLSQGTEV